jgi:hypothetical protein
MSNSSTARPMTRATSKAGSLSFAAPVGAQAPSAPSDSRLNDAATLSIPTCRDPTATPADPEGPLESILLALLDEDVANIRAALSVFRIREDCLFDQVSTLETMVSTLRDSAHRP